MYPVSTVFHEAVAMGNPQKAMLIFPNGMVFTNEDINVDSGIEFHDNFNMEENLSIGQATSNEIRFGLFNDDRDLNEYTFGDFLATCGVLYGRQNINMSGGTVLVQYNNVTYIAYDTAPYLRKYDVPLTDQPEEEICSMLAIDGKLYCYGKTGSYSCVYDLSTERMTQGTAPLHMVKKAQKFWGGKGISYDMETRICREYYNGIMDTYEFCPWGWFTAERPKAPDVILIDMNCLDFMQKFEKDFPGSAAIGLTYPVTIGNMFKKLCQACGVQYVSTTFINSTATVTEEPEAFENCTYRDIIKWIAEAAGSNARFDRDGKLQMKWLETTELSFDEGMYKEFNPYWYETKKVNFLYNRDTQTGEDRTVGSGTEAYLIQDNPLLKGVT